VVRPLKASWVRRNNVVVHAKTGQRCCSPQERQEVGKLRAILSSGQGKP
jgi:hypothetical protein